MSQFIRGAIASNFRSSIRKGNPRNANVDNHCAGLDPISAYQMWGAGRSYNDIGFACNIVQIASLDMSHRYSSLAF